MATKHITESNNVIKAASKWVARLLGLKKPMRGMKVQHPRRKRIERDIKRIRREVNILEREKRGETKSKRKVKELEKKYIKTLKEREDLKQKLLAKSAKKNTIQTKSVV